MYTAFCRRLLEETVVYLSGEYFADSLALTEGVTAADVEVPLRNIGIFLM